MKFRCLCLLLSLASSLGSVAWSAEGRASRNEVLHCANKLSIERRYSEALEKYKEAIALNPKNPDCYHMYGRTLALMGLINEALEQYQTALRLKPGSAELYNDMGVASVMNEDLAKGANLLHQATKLNPHYAAAYNNLGVALQKLGDYKQAGDSFLASLKLQPTNPVIQKRYQIAKSRLNISRHFDFNAEPILAATAAVPVNISSQEKALPPASVSPGEISTTLTNVAGTASGAISPAVFQPETTVVPAEERKAEVVPISTSSQ
ncbi:MAG: tetratricopeptide repeat protein [Candidatus Obscuribacterales bacterium]|jgi:tetratricopeptide (TPR) repeat protein|nr:tetratricopeptide repeat protein [Candidatus Obscuribacterales bacterium]